MSKKFVLVTGASTGIGYASAVALAGKGFHVFAGVRNDRDAQRFRDEGGGVLEPIQLDVTSAEQIAAARAHIEKVVGDAGLHGLVNNAGIAVVGPLEFVPMEEFRRQMNINVNGLLAVTQAFLPLLRKTSGRLCLIGSTSGFLAVPMMGPYCASKHAVEAIGDCLRGELAPWNIRVSVVEPGSVQTPIWEKSRVENEAVLARMPEECTALYGDAIDTIRAEATKMVERASPVREVADCVVHAVTAKHPKTRYRCASGATLAWVLARWVPDTWRDAIIRKAMGHIG